MIICSITESQTKAKLLQLHRNENIEPNESFIDEVSELIARNYSSSKWEIVVIKVIKPKDTPLGAVIGNYSIVDEPDGEGKVKRIIMLVV